MKKVLITGGAGYLGSVLTEVLLNLGITHVDLFSLDVEGYELNVIGGVDFNVIDITYMLVEVNSDDYSLSDMDSLLLSKGFENIRNISNFTMENTVNWPGNHQDYLYKKID